MLVWTEILVGEVVTAQRVGMSRHDDRVSLAQMITHVEEAVAVTSRRTAGELDSDRMLVTEDFPELLNKLKAIS
jgi:hypothetical protein